MEVGSLLKLIMWLQATFRTKGSLHPSRLGGKTSWLSSTMLWSIRQEKPTSLLMPLVIRLYLQHLLVVSLTIFLSELRKGSSKID